MTPVYCTQGHENPAGNRFCHQCGDKLAPSVAGGMSAGIILDDRYRVILQLGQGGFGRTYLVEDINRFNERCVLKEFAPQVQSGSALQKAQELFEREAGVLYKLQHPQIPRFRELLRGQMAGVESLFLVQDYIEGQTYRELLNSRKSQRQLFSEEEVTQLLLQLLPVLDYIHSQGVIHRDISPENLILRNSDRLPVLIDFGGVKEVAVSAISKFSQLAFSTHIGKPGYAPEEQLKKGKAFPSSDLYSLAVTALVLLTGKEPQDLYNSFKAIWQWRQVVSISPNLAAILEKMLLRNPSQRYQTAGDVIQALEPSALKTQPSNITQINTVVVAPKALPAPPKPAPAPPPAIVVHQPAPIVPAAGHGRLNPVGILLFPIRFLWHCFRTLTAISIGLLLLAGVASWAFPKFISWTPPQLPTTISNSKEESRLDNIFDRREALQIPEEFFNLLVNEQFYSRHPELKDRLLTNNQEDDGYRQKWYDSADALLNKLEQANLSEKSRRQIGRYTEENYQSRQSNLSTQELIRQTDEQFYQLFPQQQGQTLNPETWGQIWYAIAANRAENR
ncbi:serine/threonine-protein kinase [Microcoleus sp. FACHB-672]|uniref:serine/threonine-protein kinase n=1 Tax=Microcoleus sp. FACHB-672 TaxID=2692825 RepID=UPI001687FFB0|nr:serine/threonine-protein kinase [Microcoleus sp. FACHB-672]MBD2039316.1 protein kinase [Microcoleus sp. FACHB-672]